MLAGFDSEPGLLMPIVVAFVSQKGGVGKSTLARALASVAAHGGLMVTLADLDLQQRTSLNWSARRTSRDSIGLNVKLFADIDAVLRSETAADLVVVDAPGRTSRATLDIAQRAHLTIQPSGPCVDDLHPAVLLFHELVAAGIPKKKLTIALCRTSDGDEEAAARAYLVEAGYAVLAGSMPERGAYREALNAGRAPTETPEPALNDRVDSLMDALLATVMHELKAAVAPRQKGTAA